jgi:DNA-binding response OmpR family regulator
LNSRKRIMIIDDETEICDYISDLLPVRFEIIQAHCADSALEKINQQLPDLIILDMGLKNANGLDLCRALRENGRTRHIPVLIYSGSQDSDDIAAAFDRGADDYFSKTTRPKELIARILSKVRRIEELENNQDVLVCGNLTLHVQKLEAQLGKRTVALSVLEFNLIRFFVINKDRVMSRAQILDGVWREAVVSNRTIDTHMVYLRKKLLGFDHTLATVYGAGYILRETQKKYGTETSEMQIDSTDLNSEDPNQKAEAGRTYGISNNQ